MWSNPTIGAPMWRGDQKKVVKFHLHGAMEETGFSWRLILKWNKAPPSCSLAVLSWYLGITWGKRRRIENKHLQSLRRFGCCPLFHWLEILHVLTFYSYETRLKMLFRFKTAIWMANALFKHFNFSFESKKIFNIELMSHLLWDQCRKVKFTHFEKVEI